MNAAVPACSTICLPNSAEAARAQFYFAVDQPFRRWLQSIDPETDEPVEKAAEWQEQAYRLAAELGRKLL